MKRAFVSIVALATVATLVIAGCAQAAPAPTPTKPAAAPTTAAVPTKPAAGATTAPTNAAAGATTAPTKAAVDPTKPAAAPAAPPKGSFPEKGRAITSIVPYSAGGITDTSARVIASLLETELGTAVEVVNKVGAGSQVGLTDLARAKPDGYTMGYTLLPPTITVYLDPRRQAVFDRKGFQPVAFQAKTPMVIAVKADSPYKTIKDLLDAAKAKPETIKGAATGIGSTGHLTILATEKATGAKLATVMFDGDAPASTALLGGHVDASFNSGAAVFQHVRSGAMRALAVADTEESEFFPGVPTMPSLGYNVVYGSNVGVSVPAGTPREVVEVLSTAMKKAVENEEHRSKMRAAGFSVVYLNPEQYAKLWDEVESAVKPFMEEIIKAG